MLLVGPPNARKVKGYDPDKKGYPGPPGWGFGVGLTTPHSKKKTYCYESQTTGQSPHWAVAPLEEEEEERSTSKALTL